MAAKNQIHRSTFPLAKKCIIIGLLGVILAGAAIISAFAGDSLYGTVTAIKSANLVTLDYGGGKYEVRLVGIDVPRNKKIAADAEQYVSRMILGKKVQMRFEGRAPNGEMRARLLTTDSTAGIRDVAIELVKAGLVQRHKGYDFKYGELAAAEREARKAKRGLWGGGK